jgi:TPR repeat protein
MKLRTLFTATLLTMQISLGHAASIQEAQDAIERGAYPEAIEQLNLLMKDSNPDASNLMGKLYEQGLGVNQDIELAKKLYDRGARVGHLPSINSLRTLKNQEYKQELNALAAKIDAGEPAALNRAGEMYEFGYGTERDPAKAYELYKKAADQGFLKAQNNIARCYHFGTGVEQNLVKAEHWYRTAAGQGLTDAMFFLGVLYSNGYGQDQSHAHDVIAYAWIHNAALLGNRTAKTIETRLLMKLKDEQVAEAQSLANEYASEFVEPFNQ